VRKLSLCEPWDYTDKPIEFVLENEVLVVFISFKSYNSLFHRHEFSQLKLRCVRLIPGFLR